MLLSVCSFQCQWTGDGWGISGCIAPGHRFFFSLILLLGDRSIKSLNPGHVGLLLELIV